MAAVMSRANAGCRTRCVWLVRLITINREELLIVYDLIMC
jgi:hypothetical protein